VTRGAARRERHAVLVAVRPDVFPAPSPGKSLAKLGAVPEAGTVDSPSGREADEHHASERNRGEKQADSGLEPGRRGHRDRYLFVNVVED
jgi:hypothetical protein